MNYRVRATAPNARKQTVSALMKLIRPNNPTCEIVFVCIGTDRSTGDSLGPLVGTFLERSYLPNTYVYGTLDQPVHALNLEQTLEHLANQHPNAIVVAVDACLGKPKSIGFIEIGTGSIRPGAGVNKDLPAVGDFHITGIVNISGFMEFMVLQNTRLKIVMRMAEIIAEAIKEMCQKRFPLPYRSDEASLLDQKR